MVAELDFETFTLDQFSVFTLDQFSTFQLLEIFPPVEAFTDATSVFVPGAEKASFAD
jgi:hypothetical protein